MRSQQRRAKRKGGSRKRSKRGRSTLSLLAPPSFSPRPGAMPPKGKGKKGACYPPQLLSRRPGPYASLCILISPPRSQTATTALEGT